MDNDGQTLAQQFIGWQCRIRQHAVRKNQGMPSAGMCPDLYISGQCVATLNVQLVKKDPDKTIQELRFMVKKTQDPQARYQNAIKYFSEYYYQLPQEFDEKLMAVFSLKSPLAERVLSETSSELRFSQAGQTYQLSCSAKQLTQTDDLYQATYWHNALFNPVLPGQVCVLAFQPDWNTGSTHFV